MNGLTTVLVLCFAVSAVRSQKSCDEIEKSKRPHIIIIISDDMGWNDVSWHGSNQYLTPNLDALAYNGILLNRSYVMPMCTPSRASLLTGKYPFNLKCDGLQSLVLFSAEPRGLCLEETILPQHLKKLGYQTHLTGKWHLGLYRRKYHPLCRGYDSYIGYLTGHQDYYDHTATEADPDPLSFKAWNGFDMRRGFDLAHDLDGQYTTHIITNESIKIIQDHNPSQPLFLQISHVAPHAGNPQDPLRAPQDKIDKYSYIEDEQRQKFAAVMDELDASVGRVITALNDSCLLDNSIILFTTDNGGTRSAVEYNVGSNWPLRGEKSTVWEGGVRGAAILYSPLIGKRRVHDELIHITDWLPTFYAAAGGNVADLGEIDGVNQWDSLAYGKASPREIIIPNIDPVLNNEAIIWNDWKLVNGGSYLGTQDGHYGTTRDTSRPYNITEIMQSQTSKILKRYRRSPLKRYDILSIRNSVTLKCNPSATACNTKPCLYNIREDPCEDNPKDNSNYTDIIETLQKKLDEYKSKAIPPGNTAWEDEANPKNWNGAWTYWGDYVDGNYENVC